MLGPVSINPRGQLKVAVIPTVAGLLLSTISVWESSKIKSLHLTAMTMGLVMQTVNVSKVNLRHSIHSGDQLQNYFTKNYHVAYLDKFFGNNNMGDQQN